MSFIKDALNHQKKKKNLAKGNNQNVLIYKRTAVEFLTMRTHTVNSRVECLYEEFCDLKRVR